MDSKYRSSAGLVRPPNPFLRHAWFLFWALLAGITASPFSQAQVSVSGRGRNFVAPVTDAQGRRSVLKGKDVKRAGEGLVEILGMQAETYRGQEKDMIVEAPQCVFDTKANEAFSPGTLSIRTADGRFSIRGESFRWQLGDSRLNSKLAISNQVQSSIRKRMIGSTLSIGSPPTPTANPPVSTPANSASQASPSGAGPADEFINITSDEFDYQSDTAAFRGNVRVKDTDGDLACGALMVFFKGERGAVDRIEAEQNVVLQQGTTRATSDKAVYLVGERKERVDFLGNAVWGDGERQGRGQRLTFDRENHLLRAETNAYLKLPRALLGEGNFFLSGKKPPPATENATADPASVEVYADLITIKLPATNGPVQQVVAEKNVLIIDSDQEGRAQADRAVYEELTGVLELTGVPVMEVEGRMVSGRALRFDRGTQVFTAAPEAYVKLPLKSVVDLGILPQERVLDLPGATNQFVEIWSTEFSYQTNLLRFRENVRVNFVDGDVPRGKMTCASLTIGYGEELESLAAEGMVELEQFPVPGSVPAVSRRITCKRLTARFDPQGRLRVAIAEDRVKAEQEERLANRATPLLTLLSSDSISAFFSQHTNQVERIVADQDVMFAQDGRVARGAKAVYSQSTGLVELTGEPTATMPEGRITGAERLIWDRVTGRFMGTGKFKSEWKRPPGGLEATVEPVERTK